MRALLYGYWIVFLAACLTLGGCLTGMSAEEIAAAAKDKNASASCAEIKAPYPASILWINADKDVIGTMKLECGGSKVEIQGKAPRP